MAEVTFARNQFTARNLDLLLTWVEFIHVDTGGTAKTYVWSGYARNHASTYYGGYKHPRLLTIGSWSRGVSDYRSGNLEGFTFSFEITDVDAAIRSLLTDDDSKYFMNREVIIRAIHSSDAAAGLEPKIMARGIVKHWEATEGKTMRFECEDLLSRDLNMIIPKRVVSSAQGFTANLGAAEPIVYGGEFDDGEWPTLFVGTFNVNYGGGAANYSRCLVAGHAVKAISEAYKYDSTGARTDLTANFGASVFVTTSADLSGRRYAYVDVVQGGGSHGDQIAAGTHYLAVSVDGVEDVGNNSGTLITDGYKQYLHFMKNFAFGDYQSGSWAATDNPQWADTTPKVNESSFTGASTTYDTAFNPAHTATWGITDFITLREQIARMNLGCGTHSYFSRKGTYFVGLPPRAWSIPSSSDTFTERRDIFEGSFRWQDFPPGRDLINSLLYRYKRSYHGPGQEWGVDNALLQASSGIRTAQRQDAYLPGGLSLHMLRDATTAAIIAGLMVTTEVNVRHVYASSGLYWLERDLMQVFQLTHGAGPGTNGYAAQKVFWRSESLNLDEARIDMELEDTFTA